MNLKANFPKPVRCVLSMVLALGPAAAAPLNRTDVSAQPVWVVHVDCDGLRPTALGQCLLTEMSKPATQAKFAAFQTMFSFDPRKQLHGLTLYNTSNAPDAAVLLVYADFDSARLVTMAKAAREYRCVTNHDHIIHSWSDDRRNSSSSSKPRIYAAIEGKRLVIFGQQQASVAGALDVLDRGAPNLQASKAFPALGGAAGGSAFIQAEARKLEVPDSAPNAALFKFAKAAHLEVDEQNRQVTATLRVETNGEASAKQTATVVQTAVALMKLQKDKPASLKLAEGFSVKQNGPELVATLAMPASDVIDLITAEPSSNTDPKPGKEKSSDSVK